MGRVKQCFFYSQVLDAEIYYKLYGKGENSYPGPKQKRITCCIHTYLPTSTTTYIITELTTLNNMKQLERRETVEVVGAEHRSMLSQHQNSGE